MNGVAHSIEYLIGDKMLLEVIETLRPEIRSMSHWYCRVNYDNDGDGWYPAFQLFGTKYNPAYGVTLYGLIVFKNPVEIYRVVDGRHHLEKTVPWGDPDCANSVIKIIRETLWELG